MTAEPSEYPDVTAERVNAFLAEVTPGNAMRCTGIGPRWATATLETTTSSLRPGGIISGPTVFTMCDAVLFYACFSVAGLEPMLLTSELSIRFLRPAVGPQLHARATLHSVGRRALVGSIVVWTDDESTPTAVAQGSYVRPPAGRWTTPAAT